MAAKEHKERREKDEPIIEREKSKHDCLEIICASFFVFCAFFRG